MIDQKSKRPIYLDYAATSPVDPRVAEKMMGYLTMEGCFGNPRSGSHIYGMDARDAVEAARAQVAALVNADPKEIIWTSGATESDNLAIQGVAKFYKKRGNHIITCKTEHKAVLDCCQQLEKEGFDVTYLDVEPDGLINFEKLKSAIREETILVSIMFVNNEIGVIQDIEAMGALCRDRDIFFHVDGAQAAGKVLIDLKKLSVDLMSFSAHKIYGPKGVGALYVKRKPRVRLTPMIYGGGHEEGLRSGTLATHQIVGMGEAFSIAKDEFDVLHAHLFKLRSQLLEGLNKIENIKINGIQEKNRVVSSMINFSVGGVDGISLLWALKDLAVSSGSACLSSTTEPSYVLRALGRDNQLAQSAVRISMGRFTTEKEIGYAIKHIQKSIAWLRSMAPF